MQSSYPSPCLPWSQCPILDTANNHFLSSILYFGGVEDTVFSYVYFSDRTFSVSFGHILRINSAHSFSPLTSFQSVFILLNYQLFCWWLDWVNWFHSKYRISGLKLALRTTQDPHYVSPIESHSHSLRWLWQAFSFLKPSYPFLHSKF